MRHIILIISLCFVVPVQPALGAPRAGDRPKIIVGGDHFNPPYEFLENGKPTGFNIELMRAVADAEGFDVEFRLGPWDEVRRQLEQGKIDALAGMYYSPERNRLVDFSVPHTMVTSAIFVRKGSPVRTMADIRGKVIIVQRGDVIHDFLLKNRLASTIVAVRDPDEELRLLASGKNDCVIMPSRYQGEYLVDKLKLANVNVVRVDLPQLRYCFAVRKGNRDLLFRLDEGLNILKVNGKYREIYDKWFGVYETKVLWDTLQYFVMALAVALMLFLGFLIWSAMLKRRVEQRTADLLRSREKLRFTQYAIDSTVSQAFWMTDEGRLFYVNDAACLTLGYTREELLNMTIPDIDPIYQPERFADHWRDLREHGSLTFETHHRAKDGRTYPVEMRANHVVFDGKEYYCAFATDISRRKQVEEALRESEEMFRVLADTSPSAICVYQGEHNVYVNTAMTHLTGYTEQECLEMKFWDWIHEDFRDIARARGLSRQRGEPAPSQYELKCVTKNGEEKWLFLSGGRIEHKGQPAGIVTLFDITERKRMEEGLLHSQDELEKCVEERTSALQSTNELLKHEITVRKQTEEALRESETRVKRQLDSILDPDGDISELDLADIVDAPEIQALMGDLYRLTGLKMSIIDLKGRVVVDAGWQDICLKFHRAHPETLKNCLESDTDLSVGIPPGEFSTYRCRNNMWHIVTPIIVGGRHMGNLFMGQFFFDDEQLDYDLFRSQARRCGFPEEAYIAALEAVPRHSEERVNMGKAVLLRLTDMFSKLSYGNIKLARSLTERDQLTATLREANLVVENSPVVLFRWDACDEWPVELVSGNVIQFGYTPDDFLSGSITYSQIIHPEDLQRVTREVRDYCDEGADQFRLEYRIITKGGDIRWVNEHTNVERNAAGCVKNFQGIVIDVTDRKRMEVAIRESSAKYQAIVDNFEGFIYICSQDYRIEFMNKKLIERTGYDGVGELCHKVMNDMDTVCPWCVNDRVFAGETLYWEMFSPKDNRWYHVVNVPIPRGDGSMSKQSMMLDITDRKMFEERLKEKKLLLEELNSTLEMRVRDEVAKNREKDVILIQQNRQAALGELLDHIAHQWKQPLSAISLVISDLKESCRYGELQKNVICDAADCVVSLVQDMSQMVNVFRDFYKPDKDMSRFLVKDSIEKAITFVNPALRFDSILIELDADPDLAAVGYSNEYAQVILNILSNAREVLNERRVEKPVVKIRAFSEDTKAIVTITDNGGGIPDKIIGEIFNLYFTTKESRGGSGVGLHMSKNIIEKNMGGELSVRNVDNGAQFRIELNIA